MEISHSLLALIAVLGVATFAVLVFQRMGFGSVLGFIVAGILVGPHTPGLVVNTPVENLQQIAELGVVLFLFTVGLEMRPHRLWAMRRLLFGLGSAQMLITAAVLGGFAWLAIGLHWNSALVLGLGLAMSSTAIVMASLGERGELSSEHGKAVFAVLMAQDLWMVPVMALIPILAQVGAHDTLWPHWQGILMVLGSLVGILAVGRFVLPLALDYCARARRMDGFALVLFVAVLSAAWVFDQAGMSMTLGAFLLGMLLSVSDFRYQVEAVVAPFKQVLMGLFFMAVGMAIDIGALVADWAALLLDVSVLLLLKFLILLVLGLVFGLSRSAAIRTGFYLAQAGEFCFVLLAAAMHAGLLSDHAHVLAMLVVSMSMILTPLMIRLGQWLARVLPGVHAVPEPELERAGLSRHVVVVGYDETGQLICRMLEVAGIPYIAFDRDLARVRQGARLGHRVYLGDMHSPSTRRAAEIDHAAAAYVSLNDTERAKGLALTLHRLYPNLRLYLRVATLADQDEMVARGIRHAATGFIESTLMRGSALLKDLGVPEDRVNALLGDFRRDQFALLRTMAGNTAEG